MQNKNITYQRDIHKSYMKIPAMLETSLDEKLMLKKKYRGLLSVEKCYENGVGEYWYNISGKQALDTYCEDNPITYTFFAKVFLRICNQLELLEWNLIDSRCLVVDPELIFVNQRDEEVDFIIYPDTSGDLFENLQQVAEYLLAKLNHSDREGVREVYQIYELILGKNYNIKDLKHSLQTMRKIEPEPARVETKEPEAPVEITESPKHPFEVFEESWRKKLEYIKNKWNKTKATEWLSEVISPQEEYEEEVLELHPTVCLTASADSPKGILLYEGKDGYRDFELKQETCIIGKNLRVKMLIDRDTISQFHAKIEYIGDYYYIEDMNSTNGTWVNEALLNYKEKKALFSGDVIRFADVKYRFL